MITQVKDAVDLFLDRAHREAHYSTRPNTDLTLLYLHVKALQCVISNAAYFINGGKVGESQLHKIQSYIFHSAQDTMVRVRKANRTYEQLNEFYNLVTSPMRGGRRLSVFLRNLHCHSVEDLFDCINTLVNESERNPHLHPIFLWAVYDYLTYKNNAGLMMQCGLDVGELRNVLKLFLNKWHECADMWPFFEEMYPWGTVSALQCMKSKLTK